MMKLTIAFLTFGILKLSISIESALSQILSRVMISYREEQIITVLAKQLSNYTDIETRISSIVKNTVTQMNVSTSTKDSKDYVKNVGIFHHNPLISETFATWHAQYRGTHMNNMADLPHTLEPPC